MPTFSYSAFTASGDFLEGEMPAADLSQARAQLWSRGLTPIDIAQKQHRRGNLTAALGQSFSGLNQRQIASFTRELSTLLDAGLPIDKSLSIIMAQTKDGALKSLVQRVMEQLSNGAPLSTCLENWPSFYGPDYINMLKAGELSGSVAQSLQNVAELMERRIEFRAKLLGSLIYPMLLVVLALVSIIIVLSVLVPSITPIFAESGRPTPGGLAALTAIGNSWPLLVFVLTIFALLIPTVSFFASRNPGIRLRIDELKLKVPVLGPSLAQRDGAKFSRTLGFLLRSGVNPLTAMEAARDVLTNTRLRSWIGGCVESVRSGESLGRLLASDSRFPLAISQVCIIGEETGKLGESLLRVATLIEVQLFRKIERVMALVSPVLTIFIAVMIGALILSVMDAVLSINDLVAK